jgi:hypothetical protein
LLLEALAHKVKVGMGECEELPEMDGLLLLETEGVVR